MLEVDDWGADSDDDDDTDGRTVKVKWGEEGKELVVPFANVREVLEGDAADKRRQEDEEAAKLKEVRTLFILAADDDSRRHPRQFGGSRLAVTAALGRPVMAR